MAVELYFHAPLISVLDVGQHHNRGEPLVGEPHSRYGSSRKVKISWNSQEPNLIPAHPVPNELSSELNLHATNNETGKDGKKGTRGYKNGMGWGGKPGPILPTGLVTGDGATAGRDVKDLSVSRSVISISLDPLRNTWLVSDLQQTQTWGKLSTHE
jgi:hypothetical protein